MNLICDLIRSHIKFKYVMIVILIVFNITTSVVTYIIHVTNSIFSATQCCCFNFLVWLLPSSILGSWRYVSLDPLLSWANRRAITLLPYFVVLPSQPCIERLQTPMLEVCRGFLLLCNYVIWNFVIYVGQTRLMMIWRLCRGLIRICAFCGPPVPQVCRQPDVAQESQGRR